VLANWSEPGPGGPPSSNQGIDFPCRSSPRWGTVSGPMPPSPSLRAGKPEGFEGAGGFPFVSSRSSPFGAVPTRAGPPSSLMQKTGVAGAVSRGGRGRARSLMQPAFAPHWAPQRSPAGRDGLASAASQGQPAAAGPFQKAQLAVVGVNHDGLRALRPEGWDPHSSPWGAKTAASSQRLVGGRRTQLFAPAVSPGQGHRCAALIGPTRASLLRRCSKPESSAGEGQPPSFAARLAQAKSAAPLLAASAKFPGQAVGIKRRGGLARFRIHPRRLVDIDTGFVDRCPQAGQCSSGVCWQPTWGEACHRATPV